MGKIGMASCYNGATVSLSAKFTERGFRNSMFVAYYAQ